MRRTNEAKTTIIGEDQALDTILRLGNAPHDRGTKRRDPKQHNNTLHGYLDPTLILAVVAQTLRDLRFFTLEVQN